MPTLVNDWDSKRGQPTTVWAMTCTRCGMSERSDEPGVIKGWEEATAPNADGRITAQCPDCQRN